jgi:hypothetical protein
MLRELCGEGFTLYLAGSTLHLMNGPSHDGKGEARPDRSFASEDLPGAGGGDW